MVDVNDPKGVMSVRDKARVALAAAMGAGCRTCAERLTAAARSQEMSDDEIEWAFEQGLEARRLATQLMREKATELTGRDPQPPGEPRSEADRRLRELARLAAAVAANAAPDALGHAKAATTAGAADEALDVAMAIGRTIRGKAQGFSDDEIRQAGAARGAGPEEEDRAECGRCC
jgi:alkylhydroperoxidase/carboxymuconolactone decarboxylase family protein YurZ